MPQLQIDFLDHAARERHPDPAEIDAFRSHLAAVKCWQTRDDIAAALNLSDRKIREIAQALGADIVRSQLGFKLTDHVTRDDLPAVQQSIDAFASQASKMHAYALSLRRRLHRLIG